MKKRYDKPQTYKNVLKCSCGKEFVDLISVLIHFGVSGDDHYIVDR